MKQHTFILANRLADINYRLKNNILRGLVKPANQIACMDSYYYSYSIRRVSVFSICPSNTESLIGKYEYYYSSGAKAVLYSVLYRDKQPFKDEWINAGYAHFLFATKSYCWCL